AAISHCASSGVGIGRDRSHCAICSIATTSGPRWSTATAASKIFRARSRSKFSTALRPESACYPLVPASSIQAKGQQFGGGGDMRGNRGALALQKVVDRRLKLHLLQPVIRQRADRFEAALDFVFALRTGIEMRQTVANAVIDALVIAGLEMQAVEFAHTAPVAPV